MTRNRARRPLVGLSTLLFLVVTFNSAPSVPSVPGPQPPPLSRQEIRDLEELSGWVNGRSPAGAALRPADVVAAMREGRRSFDLFRTFTDVASHRAYLDTLPYGEQIFRAAQRRGIDGLLLAAVVQVESGFYPRAASPMGALGLMQVMPETGELYGVHELADPAANLEVGARYFGDLLAYFSGDLELALAAYNAGPGNVKRFGGVPPFAETRRYVARVLSVYVENHRRVWRASGAAEQLRLR